VHKAAESLALIFFFDSHPTPPKSFKAKLRPAIMAPQRRRQLKLAVAAVDERRRQCQQVNNQRSRVIKKSEFTEKSDRSISEKA
jgi:hypothetical protein